MAHDVTPAPLFGLLAEFESPQTLLDAATEVRKAGYTKTDAYTPFPIHGMEDALGFRERLVAPIVLGAGLTGLLAGYGLQYWTQVIAMPRNVGARPYHAWVSFIPPTFETTILFAAFGAVIGMLALNGLPQPYHPVFNAPRFGMETQDKFFLSIEATDPKFDLGKTKAFLQSLRAREVVELAE